jgi:hypothetical protein
MDNVAMDYIHQAIDKLFHALRSWRCGSIAPFKTMDVTSPLPSHNTWAKSLSGGFFDDEMVSTSNTCCAAGLFRLQKTAARPVRLEIISR